MPSEPLSNFAVPNSLSTMIWKAGQRHSYFFGDNCIGGEFVFVPDSPGAGEGEGWLLGYVVDTRTTSANCKFSTPNRWPQGQWRASTFHAVFHRDSTAIGFRTLLDSCWRRTYRV